MLTELTDDMAEELIRRGFESPDLDYKQEFDESTGAWMELAKDVFGMANYGGGYLVLGVEDKTFKPVGLDETFHIDSQVWVDRISKWTTGKIDLSYVEHVKKIDGSKRKFPILYIHGSVGSLVIPKIDGTYKAKSGANKTAFKLGIIYTRRDTSTVSVEGNEFWQLFWALLKRTAERAGGQGTPLEVVSVLHKKAQPTEVEETLWSNLFPVTTIPDFIHSADTDITDPLDIYERIERDLNPDGKTSPPIPSFLLANNKIYSFSTFEQDNPLILCINSKDSPISTKDWLGDLSKHQKLVMLLNYNLKDLCKRKGFFYDRKRERYFIRYSGGSVPEVTWKPYKSKSSRQLVYLRVNEAGRLVYCEHFGGRLRFVILGDGIYLVIEPIRVLTEDGENPLDQRMNVRISTKKNFFYHNNNYLYDMKLWLHFLAGNSQEIHFGQGEGRIKVSINPLNSKVNVGIVDDRHTNEDFLDSLKSEPLEYVISYEESEDVNPLTETSLEE